MFHTSKLGLTVAVLALSLLAVGTAGADPTCRTVQSVVTLTTFAPTACDSEIDFCAGGVLHGSLKGNSEFTGTSFDGTVDTGMTGVVVLTGNNVIHTSRGDVYTKDAIVLATTGAGEFAEIDTVVGGSGDYEGATGVLIGTGTFSGTSGQGTLIGEICRP